MFIIGILMMMFGGIMSFGVAITLIEGTSKYSIATDAVGLIFFGITPIAIGLMLFRRYMPPAANGRAIAAKKPSKNFDIGELFYDSEDSSESMDPFAANDPFDSETRSDSDDPLDSDKS
jgi:hypothetical protein